MFQYKIIDMPITGFVGMNGAGKTALAVNHAMRMGKKSKKKRLYTTVAITPPVGTDIEVTMITSLSQLKDFSDGHVFLDEISMILPSRGTGSLPAEFVLFLKSLRHKGLTLSWTAPSIEDCDVTIRRVTQAVNVLKGVFSKKTAEGWPQTLISYVKQYDLRAYGETRPDDKTPKQTRGFIRLSKLPLDAYDTHAEVTMIADHLLCSICGGAKRKAFCAGHEATKPRNGKKPALASTEEHEVSRERFNPFLQEPVHEHS